MSDAINQVGVESETAVTSSAVVSLTIPTDQNPSHMLLHVADGTIRWTADGTTPTAIVGMPVAAGAYIDWVDTEHNYTGAINQLQLIAESDAAVINVAYFD